MTERIFKYLREQQPETPCLVIDLDLVEYNFRRMRELARRATQEQERDVREFESLRRAAYADMRHPIRSIAQVLVGRRAARAAAPDNTVPEKVIAGG